MDTYKGTNTTNGKFYIGSTRNFESRKKQHLKSKKNHPFQNALRNNPEAFEWEVWSDDSDEPILEQALLDIWFGCEQCYNLNPYADRPHQTREQHAEAGRVAHVRNPGMSRRNGSMGGIKSGPANGEEALKRGDGIHS